MSTVVKYNNKGLQHASINRYPLPDEYRCGLLYIVFAPYKVYICREWLCLYRVIYLLIIPFL